MANVFRVEGMSCEGCKNAIEEHLLKENNIDHADIDLETKQLIIRSDNEFSVADVQEILDKADLNYTVKDTTFND
ncbi:MAG: heavy-metal-associated domain-containing protein [Weeksellaceae bacterium]